MTVIRVRRTINFEYAFDPVTNLGYTLAQQMRNERNGDFEAWIKGLVEPNFDGGVPDIVETDVKIWLDSEGSA